MTQSINLQKILLSGLFIAAFIGFFLFGGSQSTPTDIHVPELGILDFEDAHSAMTTRIGTDYLSDHIAASIANPIGNLEGWSDEEWDATLGAIQEKLHDLAEKVRRGYPLSLQEEMLINNLAEYLGRLKDSGFCPSWLESILQECNDLIIEIVSNLLGLPLPGQEPNNQFDDGFDPAWNGLFYGPVGGRTVWEN